MVARRKEAGFWRYQTALRNTSGVHTYGVDGEEANLYYEYLNSNIACAATCDQPPRGLRFYFGVWPLEKIWDASENRPVGCSTKQVRVRVLCR